MVRISEVYSNGELSFSLPNAISAPDYKPIKNNSPLLILASILLWRWS